MTEFTTRPELRGTFGMVASTHWLASAAGMAALERGGNAFDAAVTAGFVLQVVEPHLNGPAGEVPILFASPGRAPTVLCGQGPTPRAATIELFRDLGLDMVPGTGQLAACVPGAFDAWLLLLRDHGTMALEDVLAPAIGYARNGFPAVPKLRQVIATMEQTFVEHWTTSAQQYLPAPSAAGLMRLPGVADTYDRILTEARRSAGSSACREQVIDAARRTWSTGFVADAIVTAAGQPVRDSSGGNHAGLLTHDDLAGYAASYEQPVSVDHGGFTVHKPGPWSQAPVLLQQLRLLDALDVDPGRLDDVEAVHAVVEAAKLAFADREAWYGDPQHVDVPVKTLLSTGYAAERAGLIGEAASRELRPGSPDGRTPYVTEVMIATGEAPASAIPTSVGEPTVARSGVSKGDTCHVDVVDRWGNVVSATLVTRDGEPLMSLGTPGGDQQDQWTLQLLLRVVDGGMDLQEAIDAPAFHTTSFPGSFWPREMRPGELVVEDRVGPEVIAGLRARGHEVVESTAWSLGRLSAVARDPESGVLRAGANPRGRQGYAAGR